MRRFLPWTLALTMTLLAVWAAPALGAPASMVSPRAMAMGGAFTAVANDGTAPYYNPAGLSQLPWTITLGTGWFAPPPSLLQGVPTVFAIDWTAPFDANMLLQIGNALYANLEGTPMTVAFDPYFGIVGPWAGLTATASARINLRTAPVPGGTGYLPIGKVTATGTGIVSTAIKFKEVLPGVEWCSIGINAKAIYAVDLTTALSSSLYTYSLSTAWGYAGDIGLLLPLGESIRVGVTARDLLWTVTGETSTTTHNFATSITGPETSTPWEPAGNATLNVGAAYMPPGTGMTLAADLQGLGASAPASVHLGFEQVYTGVAIRFGAILEQETSGLLVTYTGGFGLGSKAFRFDLGLSYNQQDSVVGVGTLSLAF